jgi:hypothetical protein
MHTYIRTYAHVYSVYSQSIRVTHTCVSYVSLRYESSLVSSPRRFMVMSLSASPDLPALAFPVALFWGSTVPSARFGRSRGGNVKPRSLPPHTVSGSGSVSLCLSQLSIFVTSFQMTMFESAAKAIVQGEAPLFYVGACVSLLIKPLLKKEFQMLGLFHILLPISVILLAGTQVLTATPTPLDCCLRSSRGAALPRAAWFGAQW